MELNFVLSQRFHGATTLALLLNNHSKVTSLGDTIPTSEFDQSCGCGSKISSCPFWQKMERQFNSLHQTASRTMYPSCPQLLSGRESANNKVVQLMSVAALNTSPHVWKVTGGAARQFIEFYLQFIDMVKSYNDTTVFINGQKSLTSVLSIKSILGDQARVNLIHLVRDPRGFYCSENKDNQSIRIEDSARHWLGYHNRVRKIVRPLCDARYLPVRYEDLCERPNLTMTRIFDFIGVDSQDVFHPPSLHHVIGHRSKGHFDGSLRQSTKWRNTLSSSEQVRCLALTQPIAGEFGYRLDANPGSDAEGPVREGSYTQR